jgi:hypothetical protein
LLNTPNTQSFSDATENTDIGAWYVRMKKAVTERAGQDILQGR